MYTIYHNGHIVTTTIYLITAMVVAEMTRDNMGGMVWIKDDDGEYYE
jgi:hypothetical protein